LTLKERASSNLHDEATHEVEYLRSKLCQILLPDGPETCKVCNSLRTKTGIELRKKVSTLNKPAGIKAPISLTSPDRLKLTIQQHRQTIQHQTLQCMQLKDQLKEMKDALNKSSYKIDAQLGNDFVDIFKGNIYTTVFCFYLPIVIGKES